MNSALRSRGLLPMDGSCECLECGAFGLDRDEMADPGKFKCPTCKECEDRILSGWIECSACGGSGGSSSHRDYARGVQVHEFCDKCNGRGGFRWSKDRREDRA